MTPHYRFLPSLFLCILTALFPGSKSAYNIGCIYPREMGDDPIETRRRFGDYVGGSFENPTDQSRIAHIGLYPNACHAQCIAYHVPTFLDPFEKKETFTTVP